MGGIEGGRPAEESTTSSAISGFVAGAAVSTSKQLLLYPVDTVKVGDRKATRIAVPHSPTNPRSRVFKLLHRVSTYPRVYQVSSAGCFPQVWHRYQVPPWDERKDGWYTNIATQRLLHFRREWYHSVSTIYKNILDEMLIFNSSLHFRTERYTSRIGLPGKLHMPRRRKDI